MIHRPPQPAADGSVTCDTCPHACHLRLGQLGACRARRNVDGRSVSTNYARVISLAVDPIEKKPLADFYPGSRVLSVGTYGCNLHCPFCQNWEISQAGETQLPYRVIMPESLVARALHERALDSSVIGLAYTYNEPLVGWEYVRDTARAAHTNRLKNVLVSNGYAQAHVVETLAPLIDAANIDLKAFSEEFYSGCGGGLEPVRETIRRLAAEPTCHLEVTTLIVPGMNDSAEEMDGLAAWLAEVDPEITLHVTRFFPRWQLTDREATPLETVFSLADVARGHLARVVEGNVWVYAGHRGGGRAGGAAAC